MCRHCAWCRRWSSNGLLGVSAVQQLCVRSSRVRMNQARKRIIGRRWVIAGIKFAEVARIPRLVPKMWLSERSKLSKKCQIRLTV